MREVIEMSGTVRDVLAKHDVSLREEEVADALDLALRSLIAPAAAPLSRDETEFLATHGGPEAADTVADWDRSTVREQRAAATSAVITQMVGATLGIEEVARRLGVSRTRISHRISAGDLYSFTLTGTRRRRVPSWQVDGDRLVPKLDRVAKAIPRDSHPVDVGFLMTTPQDELAGRTPVDHLRGGGAPEPVIELLRALDRW